MEGIGSQTKIEKLANLARDKAKGLPKLKKGFPTQMQRAIFEIAQCNGEKNPLVQERLRTSIATELSKRSRFSRFARVGIKRKHVDTDFKTSFGRISLADSTLCEAQLLAGFYVAGSEHDI